MIEQLIPLAILLTLTLLSGFADAQGFVHAAQIWQDQTVVWPAVGRSALGFGSGIVLYWLAIRYMRAYQITAPEVQTLVWFGTAIVGVALVSGQYLQWRRADQIVALGVAVGIGWLVARTGA